MYDGFLGYVCTLRPSNLHAFGVQVAGGCWRVEGLVLFRVSRLVLPDPGCTWFQRFCTSQSGGRGSPFCRHRAECQHNSFPKSPKSKVPKYVVCRVPFLGIVTIGLDRFSPYSRVLEPCSRYWPS